MSALTNKTICNSSVNPKKILIVKLVAIGDVVMSLPLLTHLKMKDENTQVTWVCGKVAAPIVAATKLVDLLIIVDEVALFKKSIFAKIFEVFKCWLKIGFKKFDLVVTLHRDPRYKLLSLFTRAKKKRSLDRSPNDLYRSLIDEHLSLIDAASIPPIFPKLDLAISHPIPSLFTAPFIALAPGGAKNFLADNPMRRWPIESYVKLAESLIKQGYNILLTGGESDEWVLPYFSHLTLTSLIGKTTLTDLITIYSKCDLVITHDSGSLHLAYLSQAKTIALFGPVPPSCRVQGIPNVSVLWGGEKLSCRPCYNGKGFAKCTNNLCMQSIAVEEVLALTKKCLENHLLQTSTK